MLETSFYQKGERQRKNIILLKVYNYNNPLWILVINKFWLSAKWFEAEKGYCPIRPSRSKNEIVLRSSTLIHGRKKIQYDYCDSNQPEMKIQASISIFVNLMNY